VCSCAAVRLVRYDNPPAFAIDPAGGVVLSGYALHDLRPSPGDMRSLTVRLRDVTDTRGWRGTARGRLTIFWRGESALLTADGAVAVAPLRGDLLLIRADPEGLRGGTAWTEWKDVTIQPCNSRGSRIRRSLRDALQSRYLRLDRDSRALVTALLLGDRGSLNPAFYEHIRKSGGAHVLALSGMHLGILALLVRRFLRVFLPPRSTLTGTLAVLTGYVWLAGWIPSLLRAMVLAIVVGTASFRYRSRPGIAHLLVTLVVFTVLAPHFLKDLGFQYSLLALTGLFLGYPGLSSMMERFLPMWVARYLGVSLAAILATAPLSLALFGVVYPSGLLLAGVLTVLVTAVMWSGLVTAGVACVPFLGTVILGVTAFLVRVLSAVGSVGAGLPAIHRQGPSGIIALVFLAAFGAVVLLLRRRERSIMKRQKAQYSETRFDF
jgi:ComEC/Rec2-related protein